MQISLEDHEDFFSKNNYVHYAKDKFYKKLELTNGVEGIIIEVERKDCLDVIGALHLLALMPDRSTWHYVVKTVFVRQYAPDFNIEYNVKDINEIPLLEQELKSIYNIFCKQDDNFKGSF